MRKCEKSEGCADDVVFVECVRIGFTRVNKRVRGLVAKTIFFFLTSQLTPIFKYINSFTFSNHIIVQMHFARLV